MFASRLHQRLDGEDVREIRIDVLASFYRDLEAAIKSHDWSEETGFREILAAGLRTVAGWPDDEPSIDGLPPRTQVEILQQRASRLDAAYATMKFQAYQVMNQNDALEMNLKGLMPQIEAARERVGELEAEVERLRRQTPGPGTPPKPETEAAPTSVGDRIRDLFHSK